MHDALASQHTEDFPSIYLHDTLEDNYFSFRFDFDAIATTRSRTSRPFFLSLFNAFYENTATPSDNLLLSFPSLALPLTYLNPCIFHRIFSRHRFAFSFLSFLSIILSHHHHQTSIDLCSTNSLIRIWQPAFSLSPFLASLSLRLLMIPPIPPAS
jgi:hypothetical protein